MLKRYFVNYSDFFAHESLPPPQYLSQQTGLGGRRICQSAVAAQGGGSVSFLIVYRSPTYSSPLRSALMRSG